MKKLLAVIGVLAILGVLAGAGFGSAADLKVQGGTIQAGADYDLKLYDIAEVAGWGYECDDGLVHFVRLGLAEAQLPVGMGNEFTVFVQVTDKDHNVITCGQKSFDFNGPPPVTIPTSIAPFIVEFDEPVPPCQIYDLHVVIEGSANSGPSTPICPDI